MIRALLLGLVAGALIGWAAGAAYTAWAVGLLS